MKEVYIVSAVRTPLGSFGGALANVPAPELGSHAIRGALEKAGLPADRVQEVFFGNVVSANLGQAPARQAALAAGISKGTPATTVNKVCASGMKATAIGAQQIMLGTHDVVVTGGMENMSQIPYYVPQARFGYKYGHGQLIDGLAKDGLTDVYNQQAMGVFADKTSSKYNISREEQDAFAIQSYKRVAQATKKGWFKEEIVPVPVPQRRGEPLLITEDEEYKRVKFDKVAKLRPAFTKNGTVTAANASTINDGAAALLLASADAVKKYKLKPVARIVSFADAALSPQWFTIAPPQAATLALKRAGLKISDIDYFEVNEAFAVVTLAFMKKFDLDPKYVDVFGGAVAMGHPLGASGARIITTLVNVLHQKKGRYGLAAICNGGGGAGAMIIERT